MDQETDIAQRIAIVGMAGRFPEAADVHEFWRLIDQGREAIHWAGEDELVEAGVSRAELRDPNYVRATLRLPEMESFDAGFFGFSPQEAAVMDPQHRHFLECCWEALEDAAHVPASFDGSIGVFAGCGMQAYWARNLLTNPDLIARMGHFLLRHTGNDKDFLTTRVSYLFDLKGPSVGIQTACSTSLVAIHMACQSLLSGECDMALAGGVSIEVPHGRGYQHAEGEILSSDGHCRAFSDDADGTLFGSGAGVVALRRLEDALADGDNVHAVILGTAINNDGSGKASYLAPSVDGQAQAAAEAIAIAGIDAATVDYIEAHGTGTLIGDPIELEALAQAYGPREGARIGIGSVKSNIGHLDTAAGVASLIKVVQSLKHGRLPATLNVSKPNTRFDFDAGPFEIAREPRSWVRGQSATGPRRAAVNSLGVGGTNAHAIIEEAPTVPAVCSAATPQLVVLSAKTATALERLKKKWCVALADGRLDGSFADIAFTSHTGRQAFAHRCAVAATGVDDLAAGLATGDRRRCATGTAGAEASSPVFMFAGGGAQYPGAAAGLYAHVPAFRDALDTCFAAMPETAPADLRDLMLARPDDAAAADALAHPLASILAVFSIEYAVSRMLQSWGVTPGAVIGHSAGEYAAAVIAGVMSLRDALGIVALRGEIFAAMPPGGMLAVQAPEADVSALIADLPLDIAAVNAADVTVVSGSIAALDAFQAKLDAAGLEGSRVRINVAAHSRMLDPFLDHFRTHLATIAFREPQVAFISNLTGRAVAPGELAKPDYWVRHLRGTVRFADGIQHLLEMPGRILLDVGPGQSMSALARLAEGRHPPAGIAAVTRAPAEQDDDLLVALRAAGQLWTLGAAIDLAALRGEGARRRVSLPTYAFDHARYWIEPGAAFETVRDDTPASIERLARIGDWMSAQSWEPAPYPHARRGDIGTVVLFDDGSELAAGVAGSILSAGGSLIRVSAGDAFARYAPDHYGVAVNSKAGVGRLFDALAENGVQPGTIVCFRPASGDHVDAAAAFEPALALGQALQEAAFDAVRLIWVTGDSASHDGVPLPSVAGAMLAGFGRVVQRELDGVTCRIIDCAPDLLSSPDATACVFAEVHADTRDDHVVLAASGRHLPALRRADGPVLQDAAETIPARIRDQGVYLITGAAGGIGRRLARYLARIAAARLVLVGRRALASNDPFIRDLEQFGAEVLTVACDVTDADQVRAAVRVARERFGVIDGVFHAAGRLDDEVLASRTAEAAAAVIAPKLDGARILDQLLPPGSLDLFVTFSSTSAMLGPQGQGDYAAANAALQALTMARADGLCISWGVWADTGMAARRYGGLPTNDADSWSRHPLLGSIASAEDGSRQFTVSLEAGRHWPLVDHKLSSDEILPGSAYFEIARAAIAACGDSAGLRLENASILQPFRLADGEMRELRTTVGALVGAEGEISVESRGSAGVWVQHFAARWARIGDSAAGDPVAAIFAGPAAAPAPVREVAAGELVRQMDQIAFGPRWKVIRRAVVSGDQVAADLALPTAFAADLETYELHPGLLDMAATIGLHLLPRAGDGALYAPVSAQAVSIYGPLTTSLSAEARLRPGSEGGLFHFDVALRDQGGDLLITFEGLAIRRVDSLIAGATRDCVCEARERPVVEQLLDAGIRASEADFVFARALSMREKHVVVSSIALDGLADVMRPRREPDRGRPTRDAQVSRPTVQRYANEVEAEIAGMLADQLGEAAVSADDRIQELGAHSLMVVRLVARIRKRYGVQLPLATLWQNPSVGEIAAVVAAEAGIDISRPADAPPAMPLHDEKAARGAQTPAHAEGAGAAPGTRDPGIDDPAAEWSPLVKLTSGRADRPPIFCIHGADGNIVAFEELVRCLGRDITIYGLQARGADGTRAPHETIEAMAECYIEAIRSVCPDGPYCFVGYSGGGVIGYEMAQRLTADGKEIALLAMIDTLAPDHDPSLYQRARHYVSGLTMSRIANSVGFRFGTMRRRLAKAVKGKFDYAEGDAHLEQAQRSFDDYLRAQARYRIAPYGGDVVIYRATEADVTFASAGHHLGWERHVTGKIELNEVAANHFEIMHAPAVDGIADLIQARWAEAFVKVPAPS